MSLLDSGLADNVGDWENKLRTPAGHFAKLSRAKPAVQVLVTKPDWDSKRWKPWENGESKGEDVVVTDS